MIATKVGLVRRYRSQDSLVIATKPTLSCITVTSKSSCYGLNIFTSIQNDEWGIRFMKARRPRLMKIMMAEMAFCRISETRRVVIFFDIFFEFYHHFLALYSSNYPFKKPP